MVCHPNGRDRLNCFALVAYIPDPLGKFLDDLRKEIVPGCKPHAHVTILPPRPISGDVEKASETVRNLVAEFPPFVIEAARVEIFPVTDVVYIGIGEGQQQLRAMHGAMNVGPLEFQEPFTYHPHITIAQELNPQQAIDMAELARRRWSECAFRKRFQVDTLAFVQCTVNNTWLDLTWAPLRAVATVS